MTSAPSEPVTSAGTFMESTFAEEPAGHKSYEGTKSEKAKQRSSYTSDASIPSGEGASEKETPRPQPMGDTRSGTPLEGRKSKEPHKGDSEPMPVANILDWIPPLSLGNDDELDIIQRFLNGSEMSDLSAAYETAEESRDDSSTGDFVSLPTFTPPEYRFLESYMDNAPKAKRTDEQDATASTVEPHGLKRMTTRELRRHFKRELSPLPPASILQDPNDPNPRRSMRQATALAFKKTCTMVLVPPMHLFILLVHMASRIGTKSDGKVEGERSDDLRLKKTRSMEMRDEAVD